MKSKARAALLDPVRRTRIFTLASCLLVFLLPVTGWTPLLGLWLIHLLLLRREAPRGGMRVFYGGSAVLASALILWNFAARLLP